MVSDATLTAIFLLLYYFTTTFHVKRCLSFFPRLSQLLHKSIVIL